MILRLILALTLIGVPVGRQDLSPRLGLGTARIEAGHALGDPTREGASARIQGVAATTLPDRGDESGAPRSSQDAGDVASLAGSPDRRGVDLAVTRGGTASWYCKPAGVFGYSRASRCHYKYRWTGAYAAAGPALYRYRGQHVTVSVPGRTPIRVKLIDTCVAPCGGRLIDLYASVFHRLAPLSRGTVRVTVTLPVASSSGVSGWAV